MSETTGTMVVDSEIIRRKATLDDVPRLAKINRELIEDEWEGVSKGSDFLESRLRRWIEAPDYRALIFERDGTFVGYTLLHVYSDEVYIRHFYVSPEARQSKI